MIIAQNKRKENIAEYLLYMWQVEDIIRAYGLDINKIKASIIDRYDVDDDTRRAITDWWEGLIMMMQHEGKKETGHLQINKNVLIRLTDLHNELLQSPKYPEYGAEFYKRLYSIKYLLMIDDSEVEQIKDLNIDIYGVLLWYLSYSSEFDFGVLAKKFIYFNPSDQVRIIKGLFYLADKDNFTLTIEMLESIVRVNSDLYKLISQYHPFIPIDVSTDIVIKEYVQEECKGRHLCQAEKRGICVEFRKKCKMQQRFVRAEGICDDFNYRIADQKHPPYIAGALAGIIHSRSSVVVEKIQYNEECCDHQDKFQEKDGRPVGNIPGRVCHSNTERQALQKGNTGNRTLADKTAVKQCAEPDQSNEQAGSGRCKVEQPPC